MNPRRSLPSRQQPESTSEPVSLPRPYLNSAPPADWRPEPPGRPAPRTSSRPQFRPHPRPGGSGPDSGPDGYAGPSVPRSQPRPRPQFVPRPQGAAGGQDARDRGSAAQAPPAPWLQPASERPLSARAIIGDEIRVPILWCEFGRCIEWYTHPDALGERDLRARALAAGWRYDALWRLACPSCAQSDASFWATRTPVPCYRY